MEDDDGDRGRFRRPGPDHESRAVHHEHTYDANHNLLAWINPLGDGRFSYLAPPAWPCNRRSGTITTLISGLSALRSAPPGSSGTGP